VLNTVYNNVQPIYSWKWAYRCPKHVQLFMITNTIVASSWYLSSFSYMMHGHTYSKFEYNTLKISPCYSTSIFNVCWLCLKTLIDNRLNHWLCLLVPVNACYYSAVYRAIHDTCSWTTNYYMKLLCIPSELILVHFTINISCVLNYRFYDCHFISVNWFR
jgi:hypothetical protein